MKKIRRIILAILVVYLISIIIVALVIKLFTKDVEITHLKGHTEVLTVELVKYASQEENNEGQAYNGKLCGLETVTCKSEEVCNLDEISCLIKDKAEEYGIDWKIAVSISKWETGNYTSKAFKERNNLFGMMKWNEEIRNTELITFNTIEEGIIAGVKNLKKNYIDKGLTTLDTIQQKYAPINAKNDPSKLNNYWLGGTTKIYEEL